MQVSTWTWFRFVAINFVMGFHQANRLCHAHPHTFYAAVIVHSGIAKATSHIAAHTQERRQLWWPSKAKKTILHKLKIVVKYFQCDWVFVYALFFSCVSGAMCKMNIKVELKFRRKIENGKKKHRKTQQSSTKMIFRFIILWPKYKWDLFACMCAVNFC